VCGLGEMQRSYSPTRRNTLCTSRPSTIRGDAWARKNTQRQYHDRNFRNQLRSQNQRCLQLSAAACSACCFDSKSIATRRAKNTSTNQSCLQQPYHCIFSHQKVCLSWGPVNGQVLVHNPVDLCTGCGPCFRCFKEISWNILCTPLNSALQLYKSFVWIHIHTVSVLNPQKVVSICTVNASSTGRNGLFRECCLPWSQDTPISLSRSRCVVAFHSHFYQSTDWHGLLSIPIFSKVGTLDWTCDKKRDLLLWRFCSNQDGSVLDEVWADQGAQFISARALVCFEPAKTFVQRPEKHRIPPHPKASKGEGETSGDRVWQWHIMALFWESQLAFLAL